LRLYTLGIGRRPGFEFSRLLNKFGIQVLFDIRGNPPAAPVNRPSVFSTEKTDYSRAGMEALCSANRITYLYLGNELALPEGSGLERNSVREWLEKEQVKRGLKIIASKVPVRVCCLVCSCYLPERCHRLIIASELAKQGIEVVHILEENRFWSPAAKPVATSRTRGGKFDSRGPNRERRRP
jgi:uncharacterized protein (DUF488 family)